MRSLLEHFQEALAAPSGEAGIASGEPGDIPSGLADACHCLEALELLRRESLARPDPSTEWTEAGGERGLPITFGRFEVLELVGSGSQGIVYRVRDPQLDRIIALKVARPAVLVHPELRQRFLHESRALAQLSHPNLLPVYEVGEVGPACYIASPFCSGPTLAEWLRDQPGRTDPVLAASLVQQLAETVDHVHRVGILHRDIKPGNILLAAKRADVPAGRGSGGAGIPFTPILTDFGLARLSEGAQFMTHSGAILGTPAYMAPEQVAGGRHEIGPATDVHALGVILYEMTTGRTPFQGRTEAEVLFQIQEGRLRSPRQLRRDLPRDLEAICLKCLAYEPRDRYATAAELADDLSRYLSQRPVRARPPGLLARWGKWARRQPLVATLATALAALILVSLASVTWLWRDAVRATRRAEANLELADRSFRDAHQAVHEFHEMMFESDRYDHPEFAPLRRRALEAALKYYQGFLARDQNNPALKAQIADACYQLAFASAAKGNADEARRLYRQCMPLWASLVDQQPDVLEHRYFLARTKDQLSLLLLQQGRAAEALSLASEALRVRHELVRRWPGQPGCERELAYSYWCLGNIAQDQRRFEEALVYLEQAREIFGQLRDRDPASDEDTMRFADILMDLGNVAVGRRIWQDAIPWYERSSSVFRLLDRPSPWRSSAAVKWCRCMQNLARAQWKTGDRTTAAATYLKVQRRLETLSRASPDSPTYSDLLVKNFEHLGLLRQQEGELEAAVTCFRASLSRLRADGALSSDSPDHEREGRLNYRLGKCLARQDDLIAAADALRQAVTCRRLALASASRDIRQDRHLAVYAATLRSIEARFEEGKDRGAGTTSRPFPDGQKRFPVHDAERIQ